MNEVLVTDAGTPARSAPTEAAALIDIIGRAAKDPAMDIEKMERLFALQERLFLRDAEHRFNAAMSASQREMPPVVKEGRNTHTNSAFAKFEHVNEIAKPIYTKHGLSLVFSEGDPAGGKIRVLCEVRHDGGFSTVKHLDLSPDDTGAKGSASKTKIHGEGSTFSYGRRYLTVLIFNISLIGEDDDGNRGRQPKPAGPSTLAAEPTVRELAKELWALLKPTLSKDEDWDPKTWGAINRFLWREEILDGAIPEEAPNLSAARFRQVIEEARKRI